MAPSKRPEWRPFSAPLTPWIRFTPSSSSRTPVVISRTHRRFQPMTGWWNLTKCFAGVAESRGTSTSLRLKPELEPDDKSSIFSPTAD